MSKYYFRGEDAEVCLDLEIFLDEARSEGFKKIDLFEAVPDLDNKEFIYCGLAGAVGERSECTKRNCPDYTSKSGRGVCGYRGGLFEHGDVKTFILAEDGTWSIKPEDPPKKTV